jgi:hypothetical protein
MAVAGDAYADDDGVELPFAYARGVLYEPAQFEPLIDEPTS